MRAFLFIVPTVLSAALLSGCATDRGTSENHAGREVRIVGADGRPLGTVAITNRAGETSLNLRGAGMPPGVHGMHLHEKGLCEGPKFTTAGAHWNPASKQHGRDNPAGAHRGDLPNLLVGTSGNASARVAVVAGLGVLADADGTALVVHAKPDDYRTDPSGNSGDRIACAVIAAPR